jgi:hypothetical protein
MQILQIDTMSGCGTHLLTNLIRTAGYGRIEPNCMKLFQAFVEWEYNAEARSSVVGYVGQKSQAVLVVLYKKLTVTVSAEVPDRQSVLTVFANLLTDEDIAIVNYDNLACSRDTELEDKTVISWCYEEVLELRKLLADAIENAGRAHSLSAFVRHPMDVFLSKEERGGGDDKFKNRILEFFKIISDENLRLIKYEDLCQTENPTSELLSLGFTDRDVEKLDFSVIHRGEIFKWRRYPVKKIEALSVYLETAIETSDYNCIQSSYIERIAGNWHRIKAEIDVVNRMAEGDYRASGAYNWHKRSLIGRIWLRLVLQNRRKRENIAGWHISIGQVPPFRT